jgi:putative methionine-R-sulfoxide reductase with GAF domain
LPLANSACHPYKSRMQTRDYRQIAGAVSSAGTREECMRAVVDTLWDRLHETGVSWVGFYLPEGETELVLGPSRNKPACSPIGLHGVCGQAFTRRKPIVVRDVRDMGRNYVACDPRDQSEVVVPAFDENGACWAVLDLDSHQVGAFSEADVAGLQAILRAAGLTI